MYCGIAYSFRGEAIIVMVGDMVVGRHGAGAVAEGLCLTHKLEAEKKSFGNLIPNDTPQTKPHLLL